MVMLRKNPLVTGEVYHIFNRSIADYQIFNNERDFLRMMYLLLYYQFAGMPVKFSRFYEASKIQKKDFFDQMQELIKEKKRLIEIIAFCLMPTHLHLILRQLQDNGISLFMSNILNSYSRFFNVKYKRKGPLWEGRFNSVLVKTDEQLLHSTRYVHLNAVTAHIVERPEDWDFSSYKEYLGIRPEKERICKFDDVLTIDPLDYQKFVNDHKDYQRELAKIKDLLIE